MMNGPFHRNKYDSKPQQPSSRSVPVHQSQQRASSRKVVSVPVHFISSDHQPRTLTLSKDSAALKIQKVFRGFLVRKSVNKISSIRNEIIKIEQRINNDDEFINSVRNNPKERLRVNETLMSLLFKLDSIRGFDCGVRDFRKAVTRKAIALQEKVDSIAQPDSTVHNNNESSEIDVEEVVAKEVVENSCNSGDEIVGKEDMEMQKENDKGNKEILEKLITDNDNMMKLMMQMSERNEMQTRMINSLSRRVEQLEKAFVTDNLRRKKKKTNVGSRRMMMFRDKDDFCI